ncbi:DNRLRE domain-containing protein [Calycomorphotria hydatis]|uniref:FecR protein n=1 Tax=Calycomorphotria hydatis TaxID=2528027 RepID=A0A517TBL9_9PLAN|nr:DNRLRE domain-containing protein [Calycomorphotria hydatis]QDT65768.1 FecR protein [Calycomorphotria hydatis]
MNQPNNSESDFRWEDAYPLFENAVEGRLSDEESASLDQKLRTDSQWRLAYLEYTHQHACLHWETVPVSVQSTREFIKPPVRRTPDGSSQTLVTWSRWLAVVTLGVLLVVAGYFGGLQTNVVAQSIPDTFATLISTKACSWGAGTLPTTEGSRLGNGKLKLISGLATLRFQSGVEMTLEAPGELELIDSMKCVLHDGALVTKVSEQGRGFVVETANANLVDQGTEFGVIVDRDAGTTNLQVFEGIVDVKQRSTAEQKRLEAGQFSLISDQHFETHDNFEDETSREIETTDAGFENAVAITTGDGAGRDAFIYSQSERLYLADDLLLVKNAIDSNNRPRNKTHHRKSYLTFDLGSLNKESIERAMLQLQIVPSGLGYASLVPDAEFAVYGITNESSDDWSPETLSWDNAPANSSGGAAVDTGSALPLGRFTIPQGNTSGIISVESPELIQFLNDDTNGLVTLVIVRETKEYRGGGLVHAFASHAHASANPPTLFIQLAGQQPAAHQ